MPDVRRLGEYSLRKVGEGAESEVFNVKHRVKKTPEKGLVIKNMAMVGEDLSWHPDQAQWKISERGFDDNYKRLFEEHHRKLKTEYGDVIAHARFIKNPDYPKLNLIAQERIELPEPSGVDEYYPIDIEDERVRTQLSVFVEKVKRNMEASLAGQPAIVPDLANHNLVVSKDFDRIVYVDSGLHETVSIKDEDRLHVARLAMLGGASAESIKRDSFYAPVLARFPELAANHDEHDFYCALMDAEQTAITEDMHDVEI